MEECHHKEVAPEIIQTIKYLKNTFQPLSTVTGT